MRNASTRSSRIWILFLTGFIVGNPFVGFAQYAEVRVNSGENTEQEHDHSLWDQAEGELVKCAVPFMLESRNQENGLDSSLRMLAKETSGLDSQGNILQDVTYLSPSGKFLLHYQLSGEDAVDATDTDVNGAPDYIERAGEAADYSYSVMIEQLGYPDPIPSGGTYDIYFRDFNFYGYTIETDTNTEIFVHSTFRGFPANDYPGGDILGALYVTIAHEFKHAIQHKTNGWRGDAGSFDWIEMDATMMEEVVYDEVNDYYNYLGQSSIFRSPERATPGAYSHVTWSLYFSERFGPEFWVQTWNQFLGFPNLPFSEAINRQLQPLETTFAEEHLRNHLWHMTSGGQFPDIGQGFEERLNYPNAKIYEEITVVPDSVVFSTGITRNSARYIVVEPDPFQEDVAAITLRGTTPGLGAGIWVWFRNGEVQELMMRPSETEISQTFRTGFPWRDIDRLTIAVSSFSATVGSPVLSFSSYVPEDLTLNQNYPNPFNPSTTIRFELAAREEVRLVVYDVAGRRVAEILNQTLPAGVHQVEFDGTGLASGVYFYRLSTPTISSTRSMTLIK